jgi:hypothetical protein
MWLRWESKARPLDLRPETLPTGPQMQSFYNMHFSIFPSPRLIHFLPLVFTCVIGLGLRPIQYVCNAEWTPEGPLIQWRAILRHQLHPTVSTRGHAVSFNEDEGALNLSYMHLHCKGWEQFMGHSTSWAAKSHLSTTR